MNKGQFNNLTNYVFAGYDRPGPLEMAKWWDLVKGVEILEATEAGKLMAINPIHGHPRIADFFAALRKLRVAGQKNLSGEQALELTLDTVRKFGSSPQNRMARNRHLCKYAALRKFLKITGMYKSLCEVENETSRSILHTRFVKAWEEFKTGEMDNIEWRQLQIGDSKVKEIACETANKLKELGR